MDYVMTYILAYETCLDMLFSSVAIDKKDLLKRV